MIFYMQNLEKMLVVWNSNDVVEQCVLVDVVMEYNVYFVDFNYNIIGCDVFLKMVVLVQGQIFGVVYFCVSNVDI